MRITVIADDLSGAAECAVPFVRAGLFPRVVLAASAHPPAAEGTGGPTVTVHDTDSRQSGPLDAAERVSSLPAMADGGTLVLKKVDSILRGNIAAELSALLDGDGAVIAIALPALERETRDGRLLVAGASLSETGLWSAEQRPAPERIAEVLPVGHHIAATLAAGPHAVLDAARAGHLVILDVARAEQLRELAAAALQRVREGARVVLVGTGALAQAVAAELETAGIDRIAAPSPPGYPLLVLGTAAAALPQQIAPLLTTGVAEHRLGAEHLDDAPLARRLAADLNRGPAILRIDPDISLDPSRSRSFVARLAALTVELGPRPVMLSGGETARAVLDRWGVVELAPLVEIEPGTVLSSAVLADGTRLPIVTRPGSFGSPENLRRVLAHLSRGEAPGPVEKT